MEIHIQSKGAKLKVKNGLFVVKGLSEIGEPYYKEFAPVKVSTIWLYYFTSISVPVLQLASQHNIEILFADKIGRPFGRFRSHKPSASSKVEQAQARLSTLPTRMNFILAWINEKFEHQINYLEILKRSKTETEKQYLNTQIQKIRKGQKQVHKLKSPESDCSAQLRGLEGSCGKVFYDSIRFFLPTRFKPGPRKLRPAMDPFNAALNYCYAILYTRIERALLNAGLNPHIGFFHRNGYQLKGLVYDFIEPFRIDVIWMLYQLFYRERLSLSKDFAIEESETKLTIPGKRFLIRNMAALYAKKRVMWNNKKVLLGAYINLKAQDFAAKICNAVDFEKLS